MLLHCCPWGKSPDSVKKEKKTKIRSHGFENVMCADQIRECSKFQVKVSIHDLHNALHLDFCFAFFISLSNQVSAKVVIYQQFCHAAFMP